MAPMTAPRCGPCGASGIIPWPPPGTAGPSFYAVSPTLVKWFGWTAWFQKPWRGPLDRLVARLRDQGVADTPYQDRDW